jgi:hypothetical protein
VVPLHGLGAERTALSIPLVVCRSRALTLQWALMEDSTPARHGELRPTPPIRRLRSSAGVPSRPVSDAPAQTKWEAKSRQVFRPSSRPSTPWIHRVITCIIMSSKQGTSHPPCSNPPPAVLLGAAGYLHHTKQVQRTRTLRIDRFSTAWFGSASVRQVERQIWVRLHRYRHRSGRTRQAPRHVHDGRHGFTRQEHRQPERCTRWREHSVHSPGALSEVNERPGARVERASLLTSAVSTPLRL